MTDAPSAYDLVLRLRTIYYRNRIALEAADRIEELEAKLEQMHASYATAINSTNDHVHTLEAALREIIMRDSVRSPMAYGEFAKDIARRALEGKHE